MYIESSDYDLPFEVPTFADGTDAEIAKALEMHYAGEIDLTDYWTVGDKRTIHLNAMTAEGVDETHHADDYEFVIIGMNHDNLTTPINGVTKAAVTLQMDRILYKNTTDESYGSGSPNFDYPSEGGYMHTSNYTTGGWRSCARRTWCNNVFYNAVSPSIKALIKQVAKVTWLGKDTNKTVIDNDYVFLISQTESGMSGANYVEGNVYSYFNTVSKLYKKPTNNSRVSADWWFRSPSGDNNYIFFYNNGGIGSASASKRRLGICPAFCM